MAVTHAAAPGADPGRPAWTPRQVFDELVRRRCQSIAAAGTDSAVEDAQLLDAKAREFADAVDRLDLTTPIPYENAVVIVGTSSTVVCQAEDWAAMPVHWQALVGQVDLVVDGTRLIRLLHGD